MTCGLIGGVCLLAGVAAAGSGTLNKSDNKRNETVSVVSYKNMEDKGKSDKSANATTGAVSTTTEAITSYASGRNPEVSLRMNKGNSQKKNKAADKKVKKNPRKEIVKIAKNIKERLHIFGEESLQMFKLKEKSSLRSLIVQDLSSLFIQNTIRRGLSHWGRLFRYQVCRK